MYNIRCFKERNIRLLVLTMTEQKFKRNISSLLFHLAFIQHIIQQLECVFNEGAILFLIQHSTTKSCEPKLF